MLVLHHAILVLQCNHVGCEHWIERKRISDHLLELRLQLLERARHFCGASRVRRGREVVPDIWVEHLRNDRVICLSCRIFVMAIIKTSASCTRAWASASALSSCEHFLEMVESDSVHSRSRVISCHTPPTRNQAHLG